MKPTRLLEDRVEALLLKQKLYAKEWLDEASALLVEVKELRQRSQRLHRRCQQAEAAALREGQRADRMAAKLRGLTPAKC